MENIFNSYFLRGKIYEWIGRHTNELGFRFFWGRRYTNELEYILMNWGLFFLMGKIYEWIGRYTNELGFGFFLKTYEWIGIHTNELGFRFFFGNTYEFFWKTYEIYEWIGVQIFLLEDIRMNWKTYEWIGVQIFIRMNWGTRVLKFERIFSIGWLGFWNFEWNI
jgi:hypothetical protein